MIGKRLSISGIVQGVGFRPFVYTHAVKNNLTGWVRNTSAGVEIEVNGQDAAVEAFIRAFKTNLPPLARIDTFHLEDCLPAAYKTFEIIASQALAGDFIPISPDMTICPDCQAELFDPADRRYHYAFINCTNCGPRFTIIKDIPYDRPLTTMADFELCDNCRDEYENPLDRRFHAQPVACPVCGPQVSFSNHDSMVEQAENALQRARQEIKAGKVLAIKGLGGYHLACDAFNPEALKILRDRKKRSDKAFALMAFDINIIEKYCRLSPQERDLLLSPQRPIVLLEKKTAAGFPEEIAPGQNSIGIMLAYTPLHLLLLEPEKDYPELLVMTSGNLSEEPIAYQDDDANRRLNQLADAFLTHNRPIHMRVDDSVARIVDGSPYIIRRARGYAPDPLVLTEKMPSILATGAELKNTFCLTKDHYAFISHHIGDLENQETLKSYEEGIEHYRRLFKITPDIIACDLHPDYLATQYAHHQISNHPQLKLITIQHHHAHLAACLADNRWSKDEPVIGLTFDGTGLGTDGNIWGGEVLLGNTRGFERLYHLKYTPLPGGNLAIHKPARMALSYLETSNIEWDPNLPPVAFLCADERTVIRTQMKHHINAPLTSSMGRLFDAVSALLGIRQVATYEGQAAIEMEALLDPAEEAYYRFNLVGEEIDPADLFQQLISDRAKGISTARLSARFHNSIIQLSLSLCRKIRQERSINNVALSGGVYQNRYLLEGTLEALRNEGFNVLVHHSVPTNDGGISLGQAIIAAHTFE